MKDDARTVGVNLLGQATQISVAGRCGESAFEIAVRCAGCPIWDRRPGKPYGHRGPASLCPASRAPDPYLPSRRKSERCCKEEHIVAWPVAGEPTMRRGLHGVCRRWHKYRR